MKNKIYNIFKTIKEIWPMYVSYYIGWLIIFSKHNIYALYLVTAISFITLAMIINVYFLVKKYNMRSKTKEVVYKYTEAFTIMSMIGISPYVYVFRIQAVPMLVITSITTVVLFFFERNDHA